MKRVILNVLAGALIVAAFTACGSSGGGKSGKIKMTTENGGDFSFYLSGSGTATVDWGDGSDKVALTLNEHEHERDAMFFPIRLRRGVLFRHTYPTATIRTITVNGDNITGLYCSSNFCITSIDVSRCTELTELSVSGNLTSFDVSKNTALTKLDLFRLNFRVWM